MRSILFDELLDFEIEAARNYLNQKAMPSGVNDLYWINLNRELWAEPQNRAWTDENMTEGFRVAVELGPDWIRFELLIRAESLHNIGGGQANEAQALFVFRWANDMARQLNLISCLGLAPQE